MSWVKRGGGSGTGLYGHGLLVAGSTAAPQPTVRPTPQASGSPGREQDAPDHSEEPVIAPAYRVTQWSQVRDNKILLDLLAHGVATQGWAPESSMYYADALATFGGPRFISSPPAEASEAQAPTISAPWPADASGMTGCAEPSTRTRFSRTRAAASARVRTQINRVRRAPEFLLKCTGCGGDRSGGMRSDQKLSRRRFMILHPSGSWARSAVTPSSYEAASTESSRTS
jgi:hypothetical protein